MMIGWYIWNTNTEVGKQSLNAPNVAHPQRVMTIVVQLVLKHLGYDYTTKWGNL